jgi:serine/threonine-protein kinase
MINLKQKWELRREIDAGGFARVYSAQSEDGASAVVKLIPKDPGAERELLFAELDGVPNVVPIVDSGEWGDHWVLVMPQAEKSLRKHLVQMNNRLIVPDAVPILIHIAEALGAIEGRVVHRDVKPENVLLLDDRWCLADFGIARYAEATTASDTSKYAMTKAYAAPEQWRGERATSATDVYAWGVLAYELLAGRCPFTGLDYRRQHLEGTAEPIPGIPTWLQSLVDECLYKSPQSRPRPGILLSRLRSNLQNPLSVSRLQEANAAAVQRNAQEQRQLSADRSAAERLRELCVAAVDRLRRILDDLNQQIQHNAPSVATSSDLSRWKWSLNDATLRVNRVMTEQVSGTGVPFDVIAFTNISVEVPQDRIGYRGRSHSLWYCDAQQQGEYRWYETAFMAMFVAARSVEPFELPPTDRDAHFALMPVTHTVQVAWPFTPIDQGNEQSFVVRWLEWFAAGAQGQLRRPNRMPERAPGGSWRR